MIGAIATSSVMFLIGWAGLLNSRGGTQQERFFGVLMLVGAICIPVFAALTSIP